MRATFEDCGGEEYYGSDPWATANATFQAWLEIARDTMGMRFNTSYTNIGLVDCWVRTEEYEADTRLCLERYEALGGIVDWAVANVSLSAEANPSDHDECAAYYNDEAASLVYGASSGDRFLYTAFYFLLPTSYFLPPTSYPSSGDRFLYTAFGYTGCCAGGAGSTNRPTFVTDEDDASIGGSGTDQPSDDEVALICDRIKQQQLTDAAAASRLGEAPAVKARRSELGGNVLLHS